MSSQDLGPINPLVYGTNYGPWMPIRPETLPLAEQAGLTLLRYPGGEWGDTNNLEPYQIDSFVTLARKMGAEPYIHVRLPGGTPEQAVALIRYANNEKGYNIRYWSIGNEPSIYQNRDDRKEWDTAYFNRKWREFAQAMKAADPSIVLIGPELHQWTGNPAVDPKDSTGRDWMRELLYKMFGQELVYTSSGDPDVSVTGALRDDGKLTLMVVNRGPDEKSMPLQLAGFTPSGPAEIWRLVKDHKAEQIEAETLADGSELVVPGQSVTLIVLAQGG